MKSALKYFQLSSGIFSFLKDYVNANSLSDLSVDFEPAVLASISWLMLAQAAELIHLKSASMKGKYIDFIIESIFWAVKIFVPDFRAGPKNHRNFDSARKSGTKIHVTLFFYLVI